MSAQKILERLQAHWPMIGADRAGAKDWLQLISRCANAEVAADRLIGSWQKDRAPRPADWQDACRAVTPRRESWREEIPTPPADEFHAGLAKAREAWAGAKKGSR